MKKFLLFLSALLWLAACSAGNAPVPTQAAANPTRAAALPNTTVVSGDGGDALPTLVAITEDTSTQNLNCGDLSVSGNPARAADAMSAQAAAACFMSARQSCKPAVLTIRENATGIIRQFSVAGARPNCLVRQALQPDADAVPAVVECASADIQNEKLEIKGCSHLGDFILNLGN